MSTSADDWAGCVERDGCFLPDYHQYRPSGPIRGISLRCSDSPPVGPGLAKQPHRGCKRLFDLNPLGILSTHVDLYLYTAQHLEGGQAIHVEGDALTTHQSSGIFKRAVMTPMSRGRENVTGTCTSEEKPIELITSE